MIIVKIGSYVQDRQNGLLSHIYHFLAKKAMFMFVFMHKVYCLADTFISSQSIIYVDPPWLPLLGCGGRALCSKADLCEVHASTHLLPQRLNLLRLRILHKRLQTGTEGSA